MRRREFITLFGGAAVAWPLAAGAQQGAMPVIGFLSGVAAPGAGTGLAQFKEGLRESGFVEGQNVKIEYRWGDGKYERLPALAAELVNLRVDVISAMGDASYAAAKATSATKIPVVFAMGDDPEATGLVASLNRPGGNVTGSTSMGHELAAKRVEYIHEFVPNVTTIGFLANPTLIDQPAERLRTEQAARARGLQFRAFYARSVEEFDAAFEDIVGQKVGALIIAVDTLFYAESQRLASLALRHSIPTIGPLRAFAVGGGLISFGANIPDVIRHTGIYTGKVLKGAKPADLPVVQPTKFEMVVNLKTAKALGLAVPQTLLATASDVIE